MLWAEDGPDTQALPLLRELLVYGKQHCETVLLEGILRADWYRPLFTAAVQAFGSRIFAYYYDLPFEETVRQQNQLGHPDHLPFCLAGSFREDHPRKANLLFLRVRRIGISEHPDHRFRVVADQVGHRAGI